MSLADKALLLLCEDDKIAAHILGAVKPLVKSVVVVSKKVDALVKLDFQVFDAILYRTKVATIAEPGELFQWTQGQKKHKATPWVILGQDIESQSVLVGHSRVKFLEKADDGAGLIRILEGLFFTPTKETASVDVNLINPLMAAVVSVLKTMAQLDLVRGTPFVKKDSNTPPTTGDVTGLIAMNSDRFLGSLALCFSESLVFQIHQNMLGTRPTTLDEDVRDAVSELTNIIFGHAKRDLNAAGHTIAMALPSVVTGKGHTISHGIEGKCICVPFTSSAGNLLVECVINPRK